jgi:hypothetical protein
VRQNAIEREKYCRRAIVLSAHLDAPRKREAKRKASDALNVRRRIRYNFLHASNARG